MAETARATDDPVVVWEPRSRPQAALISCPVFEVFYGGSRGSLKTDGVLGDWINHSSLYGKDAIGLMVRRTREELRETFERAKAIFEPLGFRFIEHPMSCRSPDGSRLTFAYLDQDSDAGRYQGWSLTRVYVEEIGNFPDPAPILKLMATLRSAAGVPVGFRATGNPGGPGHHWVKARYIDPAPKGWAVQKYEYKNPFDGSVVVRDRVFIPGKITDHNLLGPEYIAQLQMSGSESLVRAWLLGDWDVIEGAFFDCWSPKLIIRPFEVPSEWLRFRSGDWGFAAPFAFHWWAVAGDDYQHEEGVIPKGSMICPREWYGAKAPNVGIRMTAEQVGERLAEMEAGEDVSFGVLDPSAFASDGGPSIGERIYVGSGRKIMFRPADNRRVGKRGAMGGWDQMRSRMIGDGERPMLYFFSTCVESIRTIPMLQHDSLRPEDLDTETEDHAADSVRYACMARPYIRPVPHPVDPRHPYHGIDGTGGMYGNLSVKELIERQSRRRKEREDDR